MDGRRRVRGLRRADGTRGEPRVRPPSQEQATVECSFVLSKDCLQTSGKANKVYTPLPCASKALIWPTPGKGWGYVLCLFSQSALVGFQVQLSYTLFLGIVE